MKSEINIDGTLIGENYPPYIVAELSANHNGSLQKALDTIKEAKNCGADNFSQRAVYWLASKEAMKASRVDGTLKSAALKSSRNYEAKAPQKSEIFSSGREGEVIKISCWINRSVKVPNL